MARKRWSELSERNRRLIVIGGLLDASLRIAALVDLRRQPDEEVPGSRRAWQVALTVVNSAGVLPLAYFVLRRRRSR